MSLTVEGHYKLVYGGRPSNGFYLATYLRAWLAEKQNHKVNWAKFAHEATKRQVTLRKNVENKRMKLESADPTPSSSKQSSFSDWIDSSCKDSDAAEGDDASCFITGSRSATIFLPHQLPRARALLAQAEEEELLAISKRRNYNEDEVDSRQRVADLAAEKRFIEREEGDINSSYCDLLHKISQYHKQILQAEEKARSLVMTATPEQLQAVRTDVLKFTDQLRVAEKDSDFQKKFLDRMQSKLETAEKQLEGESTNLAELSSKLADFDHGHECNKLWIGALKEQIRQMLEGQGVTGRPVPMDETDEAPTGSNAVLFVRPCPVCGKFFSRKSFCVTSCGCMYHPFCLGVHLEIFKRSGCASRSCLRLFDEGMIELFGYHQHKIELKKPKLERGHIRHRSLTPDSSKTRPRYNDADVIKIDDEMSTEEVEAGSQGHALFEVGPDVRDVPIMHLHDNQIPSSSPGATNEPNLLQPNVGQQVVAPITYQQQPPSSTLQPLNCDNVGGNIAIVPTKATLCPTSVPTKETASNLVATSNPGSSLTLEGYADQEGANTKKSHLSREEVNAWLASGQYTTRFAPTPRPPLTTNKKLGRPVGSGKKKPQAGVNGHERGMQMLEERAKGFKGRTITRK